MPLTLITGPANAAKAGAVLERLRASLAREPVLMVPTSADERHYARELAGAGIVFGTDVTTFPRLIRDVARKAGVRGRPLGRLSRGRVVRAAIRDVPLRELAASAASPGFPDALGGPVRRAAALARGPGRFGAAVRAWREAGTAPPHAAELAALYSAYHRRLEALGAVDEDGLTLLALNGLREAWDGRPLLLYGFDDLSPAQLDLVETLVRHTDTEVTVAVTYEPGRAAMAGSATAVELLKPLAREHVVLEARSEHYADSARGALHHLERELFEDAPARVGPNGAVRLLEAGGERAEAELAGASVLELLRDGMAPEDIAVLVRSNAELFAQVFETYAIPVARERRVPFAHTRLGAGLLAFARAALGEGTAIDVVTWLRTPGKLATPARAEATAEPAPAPPVPPGEAAAAPDSAAPRTPLGAPAPGPAAPLVPPGETDPSGHPGRLADADRLEVAIRRAEARTTADARYHWGRLGGRDLVELDALAAAEGVEAFLTALLAEGEAIWTAPARPPRRRARSRGGGRRPCGPRAAARGEGAARPARAGPGARRRAAGRASPRWPRPRCARPRASPTARPASCSPIRWRSARAASARSCCAGCRRASCRAARSPSRSSTTAPGPRSRSPPGSCSAATRPRSRASARCSMPASAGRRRRCS